MRVSPRSLRECCIDYISENTFDVCQTETSIDGEVYRVLSTDEKFYLPSGVAEELVFALSDKGKMEDSALMLFDSKITQLRNVNLTNASKLTLIGLRTLKFHDISHLKVTGLTDVTVNDLIDCLGDETLMSLKTFDVGNPTSDDNTENYSIVNLSLNKRYLHLFKNNIEFKIMNLSKLRNLHSLNVNNTIPVFKDQDLEIVAEELTMLENLDISGTEVTDITPLKKCKNRLKSLSMANLRSSSSDEDVDVICNLHHLHHLDLSDDGLYMSDDSFMMAAVFQSRVRIFLKRSPRLPSLCSLDISGIQDVLINDLRNFLVQHPKMRFVGLVQTNVCRDEMFADSKHNLYNPTLLVAGSANETQIVEALRRYPNRASLFKHTLRHLFHLTENYVAPRPDIIGLVLPGMKAHQNRLDVQSCATACLCNLSKGAVEKTLHPHWLKLIAQVTIVALENFPTDVKLNKYGLRILCNKRLFQEVTLDTICCSRLAMDALCTFDDKAIKKMCLGICFLLSSKMSPAETSCIGTKPRHMTKLLSIVESNLEEGVDDTWVKFTLGWLRNLIEKSPQSCRFFVNEGGTNLFLRVIEKFKNKPAIKTEVMGVVSNLAKIKEFRPALMTENCLSTLRLLLKSAEIDVAMFSAGIITNLASGEDRVWALSTVSRAELLQEVAAVEEFSGSARACSNEDASAQEC